MLQTLIQGTAITAHLDEQIMSSASHRKTHLTSFMIARFFDTQQGHTFEYFIMLKNTINTPLCIIIIIIFVITFRQGIDNNIPETNHVSTL
jgi:hypothetical protein